MKKFIAILLCTLMMCMLVPFSVSAAGDKTVVYLDSMAEGDGSGNSAANAVATLEEAFDALDLSKDCTIVISGYFLQMNHYIPVEPYTGSVTFTSVYGGVDYRATNEAMWSANNMRFFCAGKTTVENVTFEMAGNFILVIAQCNPFTIGEGVKMEILANTTGLSVANAFSILGGYQAADCFSNTDETKDTNVTVMSGNNILIVAYNRQTTGGNHAGKANITIGGDAKVGVVYTTSVNKADVTCGDTIVTVKDNAEIQYMHGTPGPEIVTSNSVTVNWLGGKIGAASLTDSLCNPSFTAEKQGTNTTILTNGSKLIYSDAVANLDSFAAVSAAFNSAEKTGAAPADTTAPVVTEAPTTTAAPVVTDAPVVTTAAPVVTEPTVTTAAPTQAEPTPSTGDASIMVVFAAAAVVCLAAVVVIKKREN